MGSINLLFGGQLTREQVVQRRPMTAGAQPRVDQSNAVADVEMGPPTAVSTAIPFATAVPTPEPVMPTATLPPDATIQLMGPPPGSQFTADATISFYWRWPLALDEGQQFAIYLLQDQQETRLGVLSEPNLGDAYHLSSALPAAIGQAGTVQWEARLESASMQTILATSERRPIMLLSPANG